jgi:hypothetical protein
MAKKAVEEYRPTGLELDGRYSTDEQIAELVQIVGALPDREFQIERPSEQDGEPWEVLAIEPRALLVHRIERAARAYHFGIQEETRPTPTQLADDYAAIERAARRLLYALQVTLAGDIEKMPSALRYGGLAAQAYKQAAEARQQGRHRPPLPFDGPLVGDGLLRQAIEGVSDLRQWAGAMLERELAAKARQPQSKDHHEGNRALNDYLGRVVVDSWCAIWGMEIKDSARILQFMCAAAAIVGVELSDVSARKRLRSIFAVTFRKRRAAKSSPT